MSFDASQYDMLNDKICECISLKCAKGSCYSDHCFNIDDMETALKNLKQNKMDGLDNYCSNHILFGSKRLHTLLLLLCNCIVRHGIVPKQFLSSVITPIPKNKRKSLNDSNNYRGIVIGSIVFIYLFIWGLTLLSTLYRSYHNG